LKITIMLMIENVSKSEEINKNCVIN